MEKESLNENMKATLKYLFSKGQSVDISFRQQSLAPFKRNVCFFLEGIRISFFVFCE